MNAVAIPGYGDRYMITKDGTVTSMVHREPRVLKWKIGTDGYPRVALASRWQPVHRMILLAFHGPCPDGLEARHLNNDPLTPHADHLAWATHRDNLLDKRRFGTHNFGSRDRCKNDHLYTEENTRLRTDRGHQTRVCRVCERERVRRSRQKPVQP